MNSPGGLSCHVATMGSGIDNRISFAYGTKLQNRIWDFQQDKSDMPDAFFFFSDQSGKYITNSMGPQITLKEMMVNTDYFLVVGGPDSFLFIRKDFFRNPFKQQLLVNYFKNTEKAALLSAH